MYRLNRQLFLENGPTALAEQARALHATSNAYLAFRQAGVVTPPQLDATELKSAA